MELNASDELSTFWAVRPADLASLSTLGGSSGPEHQNQGDSFVARMDKREHTRKNNNVRVDLKYNPAKGVACADPEDFFIKFEWAVKNADRCQWASKLKFCLEKDDLHGVCSSGSAHQESFPCPTGGTRIFLDEIVHLASGHPGQDYTTAKFDGAIRLHHAREAGFAALQGRQGRRIGSILCKPIAARSSQAWHRSVQFGDVANAVPSGTWTISKEEDFLRLRIVAEGTGPNLDRRGSCGLGIDTQG